MRVFVLLIAVVLAVWALIEVIQADAAQVRRLPKLLWAVIIVVFTPIGPLAWFWLGRPKVSVNTPGRRPPSFGGGGVNLGKRQRYVARPAPDDDPEFLRKLNAQAEHMREMRRLEEGLNAPESPDSPETDDPPRNRD